MVDKKISENIRIQRIKKGLSTYELSELTGIPQSTISKFENGKMKYRVDTLQKIAEALGVPIEEFFKETVNIIGCNIKRIREQKGISIMELAMKMHISDTILVEIENSNYSPSMGIIKNAAEALETDINDLLTEENKDQFRYVDEIPGFEDIEDSPPFWNKKIADENNSSRMNKEQPTNPKLKPIIDSLDRAGDLQDEDIEEIAEQVQFLINLKRKKKQDT